MIIDIERLHDVIEGRIVGRGCGSSFAVMTQAINAADLISETESGKLLIIVPKTSMIKEYKLDMRDIAQSLGILAWLSNAFAPCLEIQGNHNVLIDLIAVESLDRTWGKKYDNFYIDTFCALTKQQLIELDYRMGR